MSYANNEQLYLSKYAVFATEQALLIASKIEDGSGPGELLASQLSAFKTYREAVVDTTNSATNQLDALTVLVNYAPLDPIPIPPVFNALNPSFIPTPSYTGVHNDLLGLQGGVAGQYFHLSQAQLTKLNNLPTAFNFQGLAGSPNDNIALAAALAGKQATIATGLTNQFYSWDKTFRAVSFAGLSGKPTTLAGYGISNTDTLFDSRYLRLISPLTGLGAGSNTPIAATDSVLVAFANLQAQITAGTGITQLTGDVTASGSGTVAATIGANRVTNGMLAQVGTATFKGRASAGTGNVQDLTATQATSILNVFTTSLKGLVPAPVTATGNFLKDDGTWDTPPGTGTVTSIAAAGPTGILTWSAAVTTSGTLTATLSNQNANIVLAGPASGAAATPTFRALVAADIPTIAQSQVSGLETALTNKLGTGLTDGLFFVGNAANAAVGVSMSGDATLANTGAVTIANGVVTFAKMQNITFQTLVGRWSAGDGPPQEIAIGSGLTLSGSGVLSASGGGASPLTTKGDLYTYSTLDARLPIGANATMLMADGAATTGNKWIALSGDATIATTGVVTIANAAVSLAKMANIATASFIGRTTAGTGVPEALSATQATALLNLFDTASTTKGLVTGSNSLGATYYLDGSGAWSIPAGGSGTPGGSSGEMQWNNAGAFNGISQLITDGSDVWVQAGNFFIADNAATPTATIRYDISSVSAARAWAFPDASDTFVGEAATQTLTNKTLTSPIIDVTSDATGDIYYRSAGGLFTRLGIGSTGQVLTVSGGGLPSWAAGGGGSGDVVGPASATDNAIARFDTTTGKLIQNSAVTIADTTGAIAGALSIALGTASSAAGSVILQNATNAFTQTIRGTNPSASIIYDLPTTAPTVGQVLSASAPSAGVVTLSWIAAGGAASLTVGSSAIGSGTVGGILFQGTTNVLQQAANLFYDQTNSRLSVAFGSSPSAIVSVGAASASVPHFILSPTSATPTWATNGMIGYYTSGGVDYLGIYKTSSLAVTKILTKDNNPDFSGAAADSVLVTDASGNLSAYGAVTPLGVYAQTDTVTVSNTTTETTLLGTLTNSATLTANYLAVGKTLEFYVSGLISTTSGSNTVTLRLEFGATTIGTIVFTHGSAITDQFYEARFTLTTRAIGSGATTVAITGFGRFETAAGVFTEASMLPTTVGSLDSTSAITLNLTAQWGAANASNNIRSIINTAIYLN